jgi:transposase
MLYYKHTDLVDKYHVSLKTVHNWIDSAKQGRLDLKLHESKGRIYVANDTRNEQALMQLAEHGKKYRNSLYHKIAHPLPEFYELYTRKQILDIISNLEVHREIPRQYNYFNGGATNWDKYVQKLELEDGSNLLNSTLSLVHSNLGSIDRLLEGRRRVNIIDLGVGNASPARELVSHIFKKGILNRYMAIDISEAMLAIAEQNIREWFDGAVHFESYTRDLTYEHFDDLVVDDMLSAKSNETINLILLLGGTPMNLRSPGDMLKAICSSMGTEDLILYTAKTDSETSRRYFNFNAKTDNANVSPLSPNHSFIFDLLNIDPSYYEVEMGFNEKKRIRYVQVKLKVALTINFKFETGERQVDIDKGESILLLRIWHKTAHEIMGDFDKAGLMMLQASMTKDRQYLFTISGVDAKPGLES